jgi:hypothetical protein
MHSTVAAEEDFFASSTIIITTHPPALSGRRTINIYIGLFLSFFLSFLFLVLFFRGKNCFFLVSLVCVLCLALASLGILKG